MSEQHDAGFLTLTPLFFGPDGGLHLSDVGFLQQEHAQSALSYASAYRRGEFAAEKARVEKKFGAVAASGGSELTVQ